MRHALKSNLELYIIYAAKYMEKYPDWSDHDHENMVDYIMKKSGGSMNPYALRDKVIALYRSVGIEV